jgi:ferredoxin
VPKVLVQEQDISFSAQPASNLRVELLKNGARIYHGIHRLLNCRGKGMCGSCLVRVVSNPAGLTDRTQVEKEKLFGANPHVRLACQAQICGDLTVTCDIDRTDEMPENQVKVAKRPF